MTRLMKVLTIVSLSSVYLMQVPCVTKEHGFSIIPNGLIPNPFAGITGTLTGLLGGLTT